MLIKTASLIIAIILATAVVAGCLLVPSSDSVKTAAENFLRSRFHKDFEIIRVKSTVNEGNMNFKGFMIHAAPVDTPLMVFQFNADYRNKKLLVKEDVFERVYQNAVARVTLSNRLLSLLDRYFSRDGTATMALARPALGKDARIEICFFRQITDENKTIYMNRIRQLLMEFASEMGAYDKLLVELSFFEKNAWHPENARITDTYVRIPRGHERWWWNFTYKLRVDIPKTEKGFVFPDAGFLFTKLFFNARSSMGMKAKNDAQKKLAAYLENMYHIPYRVEKYRSADGVADAVRRIRFRFQACPKKYSIQKCPPDMKLRIRCIYDLVSGRIEVHEIPPGESW